MNGPVLVSVSTEGRAVPYVEALKAGGVPGEAIRVLVAGERADPSASPGAGGERGGPSAAPGTGGALAGDGIAAEDAGELLAGAAGLVLCGGDDVDPRRYGEEPLPAAGLDLAPRRDALEWRLLAAARARRLPVWGICRGFQVINVFFGGALWQDLPLQRPAPVLHDPGPPQDRLAHSLRLLAPDAPLGERLAAAGPSPRVNSRHHQGVKRLGAGLLAVAAAPDGLIEAAILTAGGTPAGGDGAPDAWWVRGVEWHPENLLALPEQLALWQDFAAALCCGVGAAGADGAAGPARGARPA
jgi:putative glutamine amidotransferase